jgi:hypothetical protein
MDPRNAIAIGQAIGATLEAIWRVLAARAFSRIR